MLLSFLTKELLLAIFTFFVYLSFGIGVKKVFHDPGEKEVGYPILIVGATVTYLVICLSIALRKIEIYAYVISFIIILFSEFLFVWTAATIKENKLSLAFSTDKPVFIFKNGPFKFVRHPFYLSYLMGYMGGVIAAPNLFTISGSLFMLGVYLKAARFEEGKFANSELADEYQAYKSEVGILFPKLLKGKSNP